MYLCRGNEQMVYIHVCNFFSPIYTPCGFFFCCFYKCALFCFATIRTRESWIDWISGRFNPSCIDFRLLCIHIRWCIYMYVHFIRTIWAKADYYLHLVYYRLRFCFELQHFFLSLSLSLDRFFFNSFIFVEWFLFVWLF